MGRASFDPRDYGVDLSKDEFTDEMVEIFTRIYPSWTIDEMLLHPSESLRFCSDVRRENQWYDMPDDLMLRVIMTRRKNPV